jgi:hypothetical protein
MFFEPSQLVFPCVSDGHNSNGTAIIQGCALNVSYKMERIAQWESVHGL